jgi:hypothetical protein
MVAETEESYNKSVSPTQNPGVKPELLKSGRKAFLGQRRYSAANERIDGW